MATLSTAGRYKRMPPPAAMTKEAGFKNEARIKALGPPHDYQKLKKCNSQQALENPDWRTRPSDNTSSSSLDDEQALRSLIGSGKQWIGMDAFPTTPSAGESKQEVPPQQASNLPQDRAKVRNDVRHHRHNIFALSSEMEPKIIKTLEEEKPVQYGVLKQICLSSSKEHPLTLLEVAPLGGIPGFLSPSLVDIRPLKGHSMPRKPGNSQDEQLTAALRAAEATPHKVRVPMSQRDRQDETQVKYTNLDELRVRKGVFELPDMFATQRNRTKACSNENRLSPNQTARLVNDERPMEAFEAEKDQAFQRFLKKLGQKSRGPQDEKQQGRERVDSGYEDGSREEQGGGSTETCVLRYRGQKSNGRKQATLAASTDNQTRGSELSQKESTSRPVEVSARFKNLNPKAREFLSFVPNRSSISEDGNTEPFQALAADPFASNGGPANAMSLAGLTLSNVSSLQQPPPPYGLVPLATAPDAGADPLTLNSLMTGRLIPVSAGSDQFGGQFPTSALPMSTMSPLTSLLPVMFRPQTVMQSMMGNNILGMPPAPPVLTSGYSLTTSSNPCLNMPSCQIPLMTGAPRPPQPVPKPRRPDPGDQQAYEAWIEWRKANEPGYALECRLRQQRRAQRSMTDKAPAKATPVKKSEASAST
ncbi:hypothetical protein V8C42DRAFT_332689 [Trichoderma barbatum]